MVLQIDYSVIDGSSRLLASKGRDPKVFMSKPKNAIDFESTMLNGVEFFYMSMVQSARRMVVKREKFRIPSTDETFRSQKALAKYIRVNCWPDICASLQLIAHSHIPIEERQFRSLQKAICFIERTKNISLDFVKLDVDSVGWWYCRMRYLPAPPDWKSAGIWNLHSR